MKKGIDSLIVIISLVLLFFFVFKSQNIGVLSDFEIMSFRNYLFFFCGLYYYISFKSSFDLVSLYANNLLITPIGRLELFKIELKRAISRFPVVFLLFTYISINCVFLNSVENTLFYIVYDTVLVLLQYFYFYWLIVFVKNFFLKDSINFILIITISIGTLNSAAKTFDKNIYLLLHPFGGWIYALNFMDNQSMLLKICVLLILICGLGFFMCWATKKYIKWHV